MPKKYRLVNGKWVLVDTAALPQLAPPEEPTGRGVSGGVNSLAGGVYSGVAETVGSAGRMIKKGWADQKLDPLVDKATGKIRRGLNYSDAVHMQYGWTPEMIDKGQEQSVGFGKWASKGLGAAEEKLAQQAEAHRQAGLPGLPGKILGGIGSAGVAIPRMALFGPGGLIIDSAGMAFANANPDSEVELWPGGPVVKGELAPTILGGIQGALMHGIFKGAGRLPKGYARPAAGAAMGVAGYVGSGGDLEEAVKEAVIGGFFAGKGTNRDPRSIVSDVIEAYGWGRKPGAPPAEGKPAGVPAEPVQPNLPGITMEEKPVVPEEAISAEKAPELLWRSRTTIGSFRGKAVYEYLMKDGTRMYETVDKSGEAFPVSDPETIRAIKEKFDRPDLTSEERWESNVQEPDLEKLWDTVRPYDEPKPLRPASEAVAEKPPVQPLDKDLPSWYHESRSDKEIAARTLGLDKPIETEPNKADNDFWNTDRDVLMVQNKKGEPTEKFARNLTTILENISRKFPDSSPTFQRFLNGDYAGFMRELPSLQKWQIYGDVARWMLKMPHVQDAPVDIMDPGVMGTAGGSYEPTKGVIQLKYGNMDPVHYILHEGLHRADYVYQGRLGTPEPKTGDIRAVSYSSPEVKGLVESRWILKKALELRHTLDQPVETLEGPDRWENPEYALSHHAETSVEAVSNPAATRLMTELGPKRTADVLRFAKDLKEASREGLENVPPIMAAKKEKGGKFYRIYNRIGTYVGSMRTPDHLLTLPDDAIAAEMAKRAGQDMINSMNVMTPEKAIFELLKKARKAMDEAGIDEAPTREPYTDPRPREEQPGTVEWVRKHGSFQKAMESIDAKPRTDMELGEGPAGGMKKEPRPGERNWPTEEEMLMDEDPAIKPKRTKDKIVAKNYQIIESPESAKKVASAEPPRYKSKMSYDPEVLAAEELTPQHFDEVEAFKTSRDYSGFMQDVYKTADPVTPEQVLTVKTEGKLKGVIVAKLTRNCQRINFLQKGKAWGLIPGDENEVSCYDSCWADRKTAWVDPKTRKQMNEREPTFKKISERKFAAADQAAVDKVFKSKSWLEKMKSAQFIRHGQDGDDSHAIASGMFEYWFQKQREAGIQTHNTLISAGYANTPREAYQRLVPYKDMFTIHFSVSGWFKKGDMLNRLNEFRKAREAGLDARLRIITNRDQITNAKSLKDKGDVVGMPNEQWLMDVLTNYFGINTPKMRRYYILETPYHNDFYPKGKDRSRPSISWASECCVKQPNEVTATCLKCKVKCFSGDGRLMDAIDIPEGTSIEEADGRIKDFQAKNDSMVSDITMEHDPKMSTARNTDLLDTLTEMFEGPTEGDIVSEESPAVKRTKEQKKVPEAPGLELKGKSPYKSVSGKYATVRDEWGVPTATEQELAADKIELRSMNHPTGEVLRKTNPFQPALPGLESTFTQESMPTAKVLRFVQKMGKVTKGLVSQFTDEIEHPMRLFERIGKGALNPLKEYFYTRYKDSEQAVAHSARAIGKELRGFLKDNGIKDTIRQSKRIGNILVQRQKYGKVILEKMGETPVTDPTPGEQAVVDWIDKRLLQFFHDINTARTKAGRDPINWREDYFTFWHVAGKLGEEGVSILNAGGKWIEARLAEAQSDFLSSLTATEAMQRSKGKFTRFPFLERSNKLGPVDLDAIGVFERYAKSAYEQIYMAEMQGAWDKLINGNWVIDGKKWSMRENNEGLYKVLRDYVGFIASGYKGTMPPAVWKGLRWLSQNYAISRIALSARTAMNQLTSLPASMAWLKPTYFTRGLADSLDSLTRAMVGKTDKFTFPGRSGDILRRIKDPLAHEVLAGRAKTDAGKWARRSVDATTWPMQGLDYFVAHVTWWGAYRKAMAGKADGFAKGVQKDAVRFANESVARTQGSISKADLSPMQRKQLGRIATTLQNFVLNEWGYVTRDVMGIRNPVTKTPENLYRAFLFMLGTAFVSYLYEDELNMKSAANPLFDPYQLYKAGKNVVDEGGSWKSVKEAGKEMAGGLPIVGRGLQYGGSPFGPVGDLPASIGKFADKPTVAKGLDVVSQIFGIPGGLQGKKIIEGVEKKKPPLETIMGSPAQPSAPPKKMKLVNGRWVGGTPAKKKGKARMVLGPDGKWKVKK